jgi:hypothetical protein
MHVHERTNTVYVCAWFWEGHKCLCTYERWCTRMHTYIHAGMHTPFYMHGIRKIHMDAYASCTSAYILPYVTTGYAQHIHRKVRYTYVRIIVHTYLIHTRLYIYMQAHAYVRTEYIPPMPAYVRTYVPTYMHRHACVCMHTHTYIHARIHARIHTYLHTCTHACIHEGTCMDTYTRAHTHTYIHTHMHTRTHTYIHTHACIHARTDIHIYIHTWTYIHTYMHTHT